ncbi:hypothetical protein ASD04_00095 [Devosia sp. Root436]|uniref:hypothetical protein n=1 Tax=Devosia sp. Root436 TaxID=1736537 RepID=UPI0006FBEF3C|nr:hypothetical protein [Devosia sp. Root436]KQX42410.1 hypothetical protein ASD04_00095 [Devosia sp. Root436]
MSVATATIRRNRIVLLTDAAVYRSDGVLVDTRRKVRPVPGCEGAAFTSRGVIGAIDMFAAACSHHPARDFDALVEGLDQIWTDFDKLMSELMAGATCEIIIAGWSRARQRGEVLYRATHANNMVQGGQKGTTYLFTGPGHFAFGADESLMGDVDDFDPRSDGLRAVNAARKELFDLSCGEASEPVMGHSIGGWLDATTIGADRRVKTETIHTWPDRIGSKINPARAGVMA